MDRSAGDVAPSVTHRALGVRILTGSDLVDKKLTHKNHANFLKVSEILLTILILVLK